MTTRIIRKKENFKGKMVGIGREGGKGYLLFFLTMVYRAV
jgi:hypothetical protein